MTPIVAASSTGWGRAEEAVRAGLVVAFPTDTVYGVGCNAYDTEAIRSIYSLKGRAATKALPLLLSGEDQLDSAALVISDEARRLAARFWPGAVTLVVKRKADLPSELSSGDTIALRVPDHAELREFILACGGLLAVTSANTSGQPDAQTAQEVAAYFKSGLALVIDGGPARGGVPSTVIDCAGSTPRLLREGAIQRAEIEQVLQKRLAGADVQD